MWIIYGTRAESRRIPNGAKVTRECGACHEVSTFYEKELTSTLRLYFVDVFDYKKHRVMQCGACGACYATDELSEGDRDVGASIENAFDRGVDAIGRAASTVGDGITNLAAKLVGREPPRRRAPDVERDDEPDPEVPHEDLAELDEMEQKFRKLEAEADAEARRRKS